MRRLRLERFCAQLLDWTKRRNAETDLLREADLQQKKKKSTVMETGDSQEIHLCSLCNQGYRPASAIWIL
jgi:hypothetical protein